MPQPAWRWPAEWEPQAAILIAWPHAGTDWAERLAQVTDTYVALSAAITRFQPLRICVPDAAVRASAREALGDLAGHPNLRFVEVPYHDTWLRDSGPITLVGGAGRFRLGDFRFTGWGGKFAAETDDALVAALFARQLFAAGAQRQRIDWPLEGGAVESDGHGGILTTWRCLHQRHPQQDHAALAHKLCRELAGERVLWLEHGALQGDDTDAHIDTLARFAPDDGIVYQACDDPADPHFADLGAMATELAALRTDGGAPYRLHPLPWPRPILDKGRRLAASYANYLIVNGAVLIPAYGDAADEAAAAVIAAAHPGREIVPVPCRPLIWQNGSLHCLTMQLPAGSLAAG
ncbi:MAG TPA: agmatine deiminase family protein [Rhodanobacteraceae bacterium]|nr:agmatine deiminase family protein [Rhodanobacteraceae bacterium]